MNITIVILAKTIGVIAFCLLTKIASADDSHSHDHEKSKEKQEKPHSEKENHSNHDEHSKKEDKKDDKEHDEHGEKHEEGEGHGHAEKFGEGKAIVAVADEGKKFKLSPAAFKFLGLTIEKVNRENPSQACRVSKGSLVYYQNEVGIYAFHDDWIELKKASVQRKDDTYAYIDCQGWNSDHEIIATGIGLLRVAHLEAMGQGGEGHGH